MYLQYFTKGIDTIGKLKDKSRLNPRFRRGTYTCRMQLNLHPSSVSLALEEKDEG